MPTELFQKNYLDDKDNYKISYGTDINSNNINTNTLDEILEAIKSNEEVKTKIEDLRNAKSDEERKNKKNNLPYFVAAIFKGHRANKNLLQAQHFIFDIDHVKDVVTLKAKVVKDKRTMACFVSPRGEGIKILCVLDQPITDYKKYSDLYKHYAKALSTEYGLTLDSTSDVARTCFFSYDPDIYISKDAEPLKTDIKISDKPTKTNSTVKETSNKKREELIKFLEEGASEGGRTTALVKLTGVFCSNGFDEEFSLATLKSWNNLNKPPLQLDELEKNVSDLFARYKKEKTNLDNFYSTETTVVEAGIIGDEFFLKKIGKEKFFLRSGIEDEKEQVLTYSSLVKTRHIHHLRKINYKASVEKDSSDFEYSNSVGEMNIHIAPKNGGTKDNKLIEEYLHRTFGPT